MRVLEEIGILLTEESLLILEKLGCDVDWSTQNVHRQALVDGDQFGSGRIQHHAA